MKKFLISFVLILMALSSFAILPATSHTDMFVMTDPASFGQNMIYFAFTFTLSLIGSYLIYGILVGPASLIGIYILTKDKQKRTYAWIGFILGTILGITLKILALS